MQVLPDGIAETLGDSLATNRPLHMSGNVWYVNSVTGADAASPRGRERNRPLATIGQAHTNASNDDIIVLQAAHNETLTGTLAITKRLTIVGAGSSGGVPTAQLKMNAAVGVMLALQVDNIELRNIKFPTMVQASAAARVSLQANNQKVIGCYFECGENDNGPGIDLAVAASGHIIGSTTLISTSVTAADPPAAAILISAAQTRLDINGLILSGGTTGFLNGIGFDASGFNLTALRAENISLLLGADMALTAASTGHVHVGTATGGARVIW